MSLISFLKTVPGRESYTPRTPHTTVVQKLDNASLATRWIVTKPD